MLTLLLVLSPLQSAVAGILSLLDIDSVTHQMEEMHDGAMTKATGAAAEHDGKPCHAGNGCNDPICSSVQCASCMLVSLPFLFQFVKTTATHELLRLDDGYISHLSASPFRPPKA
ncbi:MAG: hypothetical protein GY696_07615 [Gammaproteobacteria bacterium]|nr:hypothetical protein [Gammaproteobacteria bacterium]